MILQCFKERQTQRLRLLQSLQFLIGWTECDRLCIASAPVTSTLECLEAAYFFLSPLRLQLRLINHVKYFFIFVFRILKKEKSWKYVSFVGRNRGLHGLGLVFFTTDTCRTGTGTHFLQVLSVVNSFCVKKIKII